ncbi:MAG: hypothetical protein Q9M11_06415 [Mariprofundaceae bacterium]|nr:hypothetical protein [Mariprofundaceae bacterium]
MNIKKFPDNPFLMAFSKIAMIDTAVMAVSVGLAIWQSTWMWYFLGAGLLISMAVFVLINQKVLHALSCPCCHQGVTFSKGKGLVCETCKTIWELG